VLYVPPGWFHSTEALGTAPNLGLSYWTESDVQSRLYALRSAFRQRCGGGGKGGGSEGGAAGSAQAKRELLAALGRVIVRALDLDLRRDPAGACAMVVVVVMMMMMMMICNGRSGVRCEPMGVVACDCGRCDAHVRLRVRGGQGRK
jgi:hypothetical protein